MTAIGSAYTRELLLATLTNHLFGMAYGCLSGYPSPALPDIDRNRNPFRLTADEVSSLGSVTVLGSALGSLLCGTLADRLGRKTTIVCSSSFVVLSLTSIASAYSPRTLACAFFSCGLFSIVTFAASNLYVSEISPTAIRGRVTTTNSTLAYSFGMLSVYFVGAFFAWNWLAIFVAALYAASTVVMIRLPESPRWLLLKGRREEAIASFEWLRGTDAPSLMDNLMDEVRIVEESLDHNNLRMIKNRGDVGATRSSSLTTLFESENLRLLSMCCVAYAIQAFCGVVVLQVYTVVVFDMVGVNLNSNLQSIVTGLFLFLGGVVCPLVVDTISRKCLLTISCAVLAACMAATGIFFLVERHASRFARERIYWLPVIALSVGNFGYSIGLDPVPNLLACELFPTSVRADVQTITNFVNQLAFFACLRSFSTLQKAFDTSGVFFIYTFICILGIFFSHFVLREPKKDTMR